MHNFTNQTPGHERTMHCPTCGIRFYVGPLVTANKVICGVCRNRGITTVTRTHTCTVCKGRGDVSMFGDVVYCAECDGTGLLPKSHKYAGVEYVTPVAKPQTFNTDDIPF